MRITDLDEDQQGEQGQVASIYKSLKTKSTVTAGGQVADERPPSEQAVNNSDRLNNLLKRRE